MLRTKFRVLSQKSLTILLTLGLLGGVATAQLNAKPSVAHAMMAQTTPPAASSPGGYQFRHQSRPECAARNRRCLFAENH